MKTQCTKAGQTQFCKQCHHASEHDKIMIPFVNGSDWCTSPSECHHLHEVVQCAEVNYEILKSEISK